MTDGRVVEPAFLLDEGLEKDAPCQRAETGGSDTGMSLVSLRDRDCHPLDILVFTEQAFCVGMRLLDRIDCGRAREISGAILKTAEIGRAGRLSEEARIGLSLFFVQFGLARSGRQFLGLEPEIAGVLLDTRDRIRQSQSVDDGYLSG